MAVSTKNNSRAAAALFISFVHALLVFFDQRPYGIWQKIVLLISCAKLKVFV